MSTWWPDRARSVFARPATGDLVGLAHAVWEVTAVADLDPGAWDDDDVDAHRRWAALGRTDKAWRSAPYVVDVDLVGGINPFTPQPDGTVETAGEVTVHAQSQMTWHVYPGGRWPMCSCCGEPTPCTAELNDRHVEATMAALERHAAKLPGCCWSCEEPITVRQRAVTYAGMNLDLPGGPEVTFHTRRACHRDAVRYEHRWLADAPGRPRVLTWPTCDGTLIVHGDGTSECFGGDVTCRGHDTHNHALIRACVSQTHGCPRDCPAVGHPGTRLAPRPARALRRTT